MYPHTRAYSLMHRLSYSSGGLINPLKVKVGKVNTSHQQLELKYAGWEDLILDDLYTAATTIAPTNATATGTSTSMATASGKKRESVPSFHSIHNEIATTASTVKGAEKTMTGDEYVMNRHIAGMSLTTTASVTTATTTTSGGGSVSLSVIRDYM